MLDRRRTILALHARLVLAFLVRLSVVLHAKRLSADRLSVVLLGADIWLESEMFRLVPDRALQLLVRGFALNALVLPVRQYVDKCREDGLSYDAPACRIVIMRRAHGWFYTLRSGCHEGRGRNPGADCVKFFPFAGVGRRLNRRPAIRHGLKFSH